MSATPPISRICAVRYRSAPNGPRMHPLLLLLADPVGRHGRTGEQRPGTLARISQDRLGQPRHRPAPVGQRRTDGVHHSLTRYPGAGIEAQRPSRRPNVVQPFDGSVLSDPALPSGPRGRQLGIGSGKSLSSFPSPARSTARRRTAAASSTSNSAPRRSTQCRACARASLSWRRLYARAASATEATTTRNITATSTIAASKTVVTGPTVLPRPA